MDNAPSQQSKPSGEEPENREALSQQRFGPSKGQLLQPFDSGSRRRGSSRLENADMHQESGGRTAPPSAMSMGDIRSALPSYHPSPMQPQYHPAVHSSSVLYPMHSLSSYTNAASNGAVPFNTHFAQMYTPFTQQQHQNASMQHGIPNYQLFMSNMNAHLNSSLPNQTMAYGQGYYPQNIYTAPVAHGPGPSNTSLYPSPGGQYHNPQEFTAQTPTILPREGRQQVPKANYDVLKTIVDGSTPMRSTPTQSISTGTESSQPSSTSGSSSAWGPPRKPKQSGHALWVGNLPAGTNVVDLKDHFSQDATKDIQSVFLISKSNCAFINYKTEAACIAALTRFHDSRFNGVRLVCRPRRGLTSPGKTVGIQSAPVPSFRESGEMNSYGPDDEVKQDPGMQLAQRRHTASNASNRYFIVKSLTIGDLELSRQSGIWATQSHNEANLNRAFESAPNVYLIFSANKSGEYYGYARMMSPIQEDHSLAMEMPLRLEHTLAEPEESAVIPTQATVTAPTGRIIDDSARGTIFWEADSSEDDDDRNGDGQQEDVENRGDESDGDENGCGAENSRPDKNAVDLGEEASESGFNSIGRPFRIQWLSAERVPFHRTRGLRNPWNANREVKIARDGTEMEPSVGERLIQLFHTPPPGHNLPIYHSITSLSS